MEIKSGGGLRGHCVAPLRRCASVVCAVGYVAIVLRHYAVVHPLCAR